MFMSETGASGGKTPPMGPLGARSRGRPAGRPRRDDPVGDPVGDRSTAAFAPTTTRFSAGPENLSPE
jgi:hypothetical protein